VGAQGFSPAKISAITTGFSPGPLAGFATAALFPTHLGLVVRFAIEKSCQAPSSPNQFKTKQITLADEFHLNC
jgi:hypothetical protein